MEARVLSHLVTLRIMWVSEDRIGSRNGCGYQTIIHNIIIYFYCVAPEVLGPEMYDLSCDMWSIGVITYIL